jgi:acyl carrier protein
MKLTPEKLLTHLKDKAGLDASAIQPDTALFTSNLLDSFSLIDLILFVETEMDAKISPDDVRIENFDSITQILQFAESWQGGAPV